MPKQKNIKILHSDLPDISFGRSAESYFRSLESYLRKNSRSYNIEEKICTVDVHDKNDAMSLGFHLDLHQIEYFDGLKTSPLILIDTEKKRGRSKGMLFDSTGKKTSMRKVKEEALREVKLNCLEQREIIQRAILTKKKLVSAIAKGELAPIRMGNKCYIDKQELVIFIKGNKG